MPRQLCSHHPKVDYTKEWGCPECVRQLRIENKRLRNAAQLALDGITLAPLRALIEQGPWRVGERWTTRYPNQLFEVVLVKKDGSAMLQMIQPVVSKPMKQLNVPEGWALKVE